MRPWPHLTDDLPAPRDDEPSSLRQDIADELADHLNCAFTRELHLTRDEEKAKEKALDRFGDPRRIARKLWLDAMQEKLMSQRMTFVALVVVLLASLGSTALTWFLVDQARQVNQTMLDQSREANAALLQQSQDSNRALVEQSQKANEALIAKLTQLSPAAGASAEPPKSLEWNPVKVKLATGETPSKPAVGYEVALSGHILDTAKDVTITRKSDEQGIVDMGLIRPGKHTLNVKTPWGELREQRTITVLPGQSLATDVVCPGAPLSNAKIQMGVAWPEDLRDKGLWTVCRFTQERRTFGGDDSWFTRTGNEERVVLVGPDGGVIPFSVANRDRIQGDNQAWPFALMRRLRELTGLGVGLDDRGNSINEINFIFDNVPSSDAVEWSGAHYRLADLLVAGTPAELAPVDRITQVAFQDSELLALNLEAADKLQKVIVLGGLLTDRNGVKPQFGSGPLREKNLWKLAGVTLNTWVASAEGSNYPAYFAESRKAQPVLVANPDEVNRWRIPIPSRLADLVRENLKTRRDAENANPAAEPAEKSGN